MLLAVALPLVSSWAGRSALLTALMLGVPDILIFARCCLLVAGPATGDCCINCSVAVVSLMLGPS